MSTPVKERSLPKYKTLYFLVFGGLGVLYPYLPVYFKSLRMNKADIGILCMLPNFTSFIVAPLFSIFGDMFHAHYELMIVSLVTSTIATMAILPVRSFVGLALIVLLGSILRAPLTPQVDALVMSTLANKQRYGELRLWGSISYGLFSFFGGIMTSGSHTGVGEEGQDKMKPRQFRFIFYTHCFCFFISGFLLLYLANKQHLDDMIQVIRDREGRAYELVHPHDQPDDHKEKKVD